MYIQFNFPLSFSCIYLIITFLAERGFFDTIIDTNLI